MRRIAYYCIAVCSMLGLFGIPPGQKPQRLAPAMIDNVAQVDFENTRYDVLCWQMGTTTACAEGVKFIETGIGAGRLHEAFGRNSLAAAGSDEFVLTFDPPIVGTFGFSMALNPDSAWGWPSVTCDGVVREPPGPLAVDEVYATSVPRAAECVVSGAILDDLRLSSPTGPPMSNAITPCETCRPGARCTPCCHNCATHRCYDYCREYPENCGDCEDIEYWDCLDYKCREQK